MHTPARLVAALTVLAAACASPQVDPPLPREPLLLSTISPRRTFAAEPRSQVADQTAEVVGEALAALGAGAVTTLRRGEDQLAVVLPERDALDPAAVAALLGSRASVWLAVLASDAGEPGAAEALGRLHAALAGGAEPRALDLPALAFHDGETTFAFAHVPASVSALPLQAELGVPPGLVLVRLETAVARRYGELEIAHVSHPPGGGLVVHLARERTQAFAAFTGENAGGRLALVVDGHLVAPPFPITGPLEGPLQVGAPADETVAALHARLALLGTPGRLGLPRALPEWVD